MHNRPLIGKGLEDGAFEEPAERIIKELSEGDTEFRVPVSEMEAQHADVIQAWNRLDLQARPYRQDYSRWTLINDWQEKEDDPLKYIRDTAEFTGPEMEGLFKMAQGMMSFLFAEADDMADIEDPTEVLRLELLRARMDSLLTERIVARGIRQAFYHLKDTSTQKAPAEFFAQPQDYQAAWTAMLGAEDFCGYHTAQIFAKAQFLQKACEGLEALTGMLSTFGKAVGMPLKVMKEIRAEGRALIPPEDTAVTYFMHESDWAVETAQAWYATPAITAGNT
ncbi:hypothetical protein CMO91_03830 [Candidatus Woesearchaeota archaeon]|nr:hypothetical protein [Candidatus Woesearchaeota archaeon]|tara:strand:- start:594 stop:1430 length:837 start_codon:yes stop_codon:yes gene_type:complete